LYKHPRRLCSTVVITLSTYTANKYGDSTPPCRIHRVNLKKHDVTEFNFTHVKHLANQSSSKMFTSSKWSINVQNKPKWFMRSKALEYLQRTDLQ